MTWSILLIAVVAAIGSIVSIGIVLLVVFLTRAKRPPSPEDED
jgi:hypothetical protein